LSEDHSRSILTIGTPLSQRLLFFLGAHLGPVALLILGRTWRVQVSGWERVLQAFESRAPLVMITWHGRMMVPTWQVRRRKIVTMISRHRDGEFVARLVKQLGFITVRGSSTRGGTAAALEMLDLIRKGHAAAMICDGPRGPIYKLKPGAAFLAMQAGATVIPASFSARRAWVLHSWDRFMIPKPFARVHLLFGDPIPPAGSDATLRDFTRELETALNDLTARADEIAMGGENRRAL